MDIFDKRDIILNLQQSMLLGNVNKSECFLALINFENNCCNSGVSGFLQDYEESELDHIEKFITEYKFTSIEKVIVIIRKYINKYGLNFIDNLNDIEYDEVSQYDDEFFEIHDEFTNSIYSKFISKK